MSSTTDMRSRSFFGFFALTVYWLCPLAHANLANNTFGYTGQPLNTTTHLLQLGGYRAYQPETGAFVQQDSYSPFSNNRTFNGFNYAVGNPIIMQDASGHMPAWVHQSWNSTNNGLLMTLLMVSVNLWGLAKGYGELSAMLNEGPNAEESANTYTDGGANEAATDHNSDKIDKIFPFWSRKAELLVGMSSQVLAIAGAGLSYASHFSPQLNHLDSIWSAMDWVGATFGFLFVKGPTLFNEYELGQTPENCLARGIFNVEKQTAKGLRQLWRPFGLETTNFVRSGSYGTAFFITKMPLLIGANAAAIGIYHSASHGHPLPGWV